MELLFYYSIYIYIIINLDLKSKYIFFLNKKKIKLLMITRKQIY